MKEAKIIIGANFGDEGKGLITDYICSNSKKPIVIRFNSGAQAGHTVVTKEGKRHVFGHFGAGSFQNIPTFLSQFFVVNPLLFIKEYNELKKIGLSPKVYIDEECIITTPYDMIINQIVETSRKDSRHGSCGVGFNETIIRNNNAEYSFKIKDLKYKNIKDVLYKIKNEYIKLRLKALEVSEIPYKYKWILENDKLIDNFISDLKYFLELVQISDFNNIFESYYTGVFEGAQGLMLHKDYKYFPHVTHSNTGIENALTLLNNKRDLNIEAIYITRSYLTRHGAGPCPNELINKPYNKIKDLTNIPNEFQGTLRFGLLDIDLLKDNINYDYNKGNNFIIKKSIAITCLDVIDNKAKYIKDNKLSINDKEQFIEDIIKSIKPYNYYLSFGDRREDVIKY